MGVSKIFFILLLEAWSVQERLSLDKLQYLYVKTLAGDQCSKKINELSGDSGGSLVCNGTSTGVVSFNWPCANNIPDVYANTYKYNSCIEENTKSP